MKIDKESLKEYINNRYKREYIVHTIKSTIIKKVRYNKDSVEPNSKYFETALRYGNVHIDMIVVEWSGNSDGIFSNDRYNLFTLDGYQEWLIEVRDKKLLDLGI